MPKKDPILKSNFISTVFIILWLIFFVFFILYFWESNIYFRFSIFAFWYLLSILSFKNLIFSIHFHLGVWLLAWLLSSLLSLPFLPQVTSISSLPLRLLYLTLWISLGVLGCGEHSGNWLWLDLSLPFWLPLFSSWSSLSSSSLSSFLCNSVNFSGCSRLWRAHRELIIGQVAFSPFDSPASPPAFL